VKEIDKKEIQEKIRQTQAKLAGTGGRGKSLKAKYRRAKREEMAEQSGAEETTSNTLQVTEFVSVSELANLLDVSYADVISKCMSLGMMVSINQRLEADVIELVAGEFGYTVEFIGIELRSWAMWTMVRPRCLTISGAPMWWPGKPGASPSISEPTR
jgi:translation initiation factor IF-2